MEPVFSREIVASEGEFLHRKSSIVEPVACCASHEGTLSYTGCSGMMLGETWSCCCVSCFLG